MVGIRILFEKKWRYFMVGTVFSFFSKKGTVFFCFVYTRVWRQILWPVVACTIQGGGGMLSQSESP
jgi:hypothetical protein